MWSVLRHRALASWWMHWFQHGTAEIGEINWIKLVIALEGIRKNDDDFVDGSASVVSKCLGVHD